MDTQHRFVSSKYIKSHVTNYFHSTVYYRKPWTVVKMNAPTNFTFSNILTQEINLNYTFPLFQINDISVKCAINNIQYNQFNQCNYIMITEYDIDIGFSSKNKQGLIDTPAFSHLGIFCFVQYQRRSV